MHFLWEILREFFKICKSSVGNASGNAVGNSVGNVVGNAAGNAVGNLVGNGWGNDAVFSLNTWLRMIYCLQTIHEPACVILTLFQFLNLSLCTQCRLITVVKFIKKKKLRAHEWLNCKSDWTVTNMAKLNDKYSLQ